MDDVRRELATLRGRLRLQMVALCGLLVVLLFATGGADVVARTLVESDAWTIRTKKADLTLTPRLVVTTDVDTARVKVVDANIELAQQSSTPSTTTAGALWYDSTNGKLMYRNSTAWVEAGAGAGGVPTGGILAWTTNTAPTGYLFCAGQAESRTTYATLFGVIGTTYGAGNGSTTFNVPDLRGRFPLGKDNMGGTSANRVTATQADNLGQGSGAENHTLTVAELPAHSHSINKGSGVFASGGTHAIHSNTFNGTQNTASTGDGQPHNNMSPYVTLNYVIKH